MSADMGTHKMARAKLMDMARTIHSEKPIGENTDPLEIAVLRWFFHECVADAFEYAHREADDVHVPTLTKMLMETTAPWWSNAPKPTPDQLEEWQAEMDCIAPEDQPTAQR